MSGKNKKQSSKVPNSVENIPSEKNNSQKLSWGIRILLISLVIAAFVGFFILLSYSLGSSGM